jgi:hypothetical protein
MANLIWFGETSTIFSFAADHFLRISRQHLFTDGAHHRARSVEMPPTTSLLVAGQTHLSGEQQSGTSPYPGGEFLDPPMFRAADHSRLDMCMTGTAKLSGDRS